MPQPNPPPRTRRPAEAPLDLDDAPPGPGGGLVALALAVRLAVPVLLVGLAVGLLVVVLQLAEVSRQAAASADRVAGLTAEVRELRAKAAESPDITPAADAAKRLDDARGTVDAAAKDLAQARAALDGASKRLDTAEKAFSADAQKEAAKQTAEANRLRGELVAEKKRADDAVQLAERLKSTTTDPKGLQANEAERKALQDTSRKAQALIDKLDKGDITAAAAEEVKKLREALVVSNEAFKKSLESTDRRVAELATKFEAVEKRFQIEARPADVLVVALNTKGFRVADHPGPFRDLLGQGFGSRFAGYRLGFAVFTGKEPKAVVAVGAVPAPDALAALPEPAGAGLEPDAVPDALPALLPPPPAPAPPGLVRRCVLVCPVCPPPDPAGRWGDVKADAVLIGLAGDPLKDPPAADQVRGWVAFCAARGGTVAVLDGKAADLDDQLTYHLRRLAQPLPR